MSKRKEKKRLHKAATIKNIEFWEKMKNWKVGSDYFKVLIEKSVQKGNCCGECDQDERTIRIDERSANMESLHPIATLFHELGHAVVNTFGDIGDEENDEAVEFWVDFFSESLTMLMLDNPEQFRAILERVEERKREVEGSK